MKKVALLPNVQKDTSLLLTRRIIEILSSSGAEIYLPNTINGNFENVVFLPIERIFSDIDFVITVGGDGTILRIAEELSENEIPVIGVNLGRLGFMAELEADEINLLTNLFNDNYSIEKRMMLDVSIIRKGEVFASYRALNDAVVSKGSISKMAELDVFCDGTCVSHFNSDGIIISTPTGSTAYSLSAGGAIIDPSLDCILLTPVCPHSFLNSRPIVFSQSSVITIQDVQDREDNIYLTVDGRINEQLEYSDFVRVSASSKTIKLIKLKKEAFYNRVYQKISEKII